jgi:hypothetical protein
MSEIETAANPAGESEAVQDTTPAIDQTEAQTPAEGTGDEEETDGLDDLLKAATGADEASPKAVEVEYEGKKYSLPPELKDALLRQSDYTRKTTEVAEQRREVESLKAQVEQLSTASHEQIEAVISAKTAKARVDALLATPIEGLSQDQINALRLDLADAERAYATSTVKAQEAARKSEEQRGQQFAKAVEAARAEAAKHIPNFSDARLAELGSLVKSLGGSPDAVKQIADPTALRVLHLADIGAKFIERQRQAGKARAAQEVQPAAEVGGQKATGARKDLVRDADKMSADEWLKLRNAQLAKRK